MVLINDGILFISWETVLDFSYEWANLLQMSWGLNRSTFGYWNEIYWYQTICHTFSSNTNAVWRIDLKRQVDSCLIGMKHLRSRRVIHLLKHMRNNNKLTIRMVLLPTILKPQPGFLSVKCYNMMFRYASWKRHGLPAGLPVL